MNKSSCAPNPSAGPIHLLFSQIIIHIMGHTFVNNDKPKIKLAHNIHTHEHQENEEEMIIHYNHSMQWIMLDMVRYVQVID